MKKLLVLFLLLLVAAGLGAQTFEYTYDAAGNRVKRQLIVMKSATSTDTNNNETSAPVPEQLGEMTISVFPNPIEQRLNVNITNLPQATTGKIQIFDLSGREVMSRGSISTANSFDMSTQPAGIYILRLSTTAEQKEWKIIKE